MDYTNNPDSNQHPNAHDYELLEAIYGHLDTTSTLLNAAASLPLEDSNDPKAWGKEVHRSEDGGLSTFVQDLGHGNRVIRHVYWVEPRGGHHHHD